MSYRENEPTGQFTPKWDYRYTGLKLDHMAVRGGTLEGIYPDTIYRIYDQAGNTIRSGQKQYRSGGSSPGWQKAVHANHYYDGNNRLAYVQTFLERKDNTNDGAWEEFRYDALGRRVLMRSRTDSLCHMSDCYSYIARYVYDGDQFLYELRAQGNDDAHLDLEAHLAYPDFETLQRQGVATTLDRGVSSTS